MLAHVLHMLANVKNKKGAKKMTEKMELEKRIVHIKKQMFKTQNTVRIDVSDDCVNLPGRTKYQVYLDKLESIIIIKDENTYELYFEVKGTASTDDYVYKMFLGSYNSITTLKNAIRANIKNQFSVRELVIK